MGLGVVRTLDYEEVSGNWDDEPGGVVLEEEPIKSRGEDTILLGDNDGSAYSKEEVISKGKKRNVPRLPLIDGSRRESCTPLQHWADIADASGAHRTVKTIEIGRLTNPPPPNPSRVAAAVKKAQ